MTHFLWYNASVTACNLYETPRPKDKRERHTRWISILQLSTTSICVSKKVAWTDSVGGEKNTLNFEFRANRDQPSRAPRFSTIVCLCSRNKGSSSSITHDAIEARSQCGTWAAHVPRAQLHLGSFLWKSTYGGAYYTTHTDGRAGGRDRIECGGGDPSTWCDFNVALGSHALPHCACVMESTLRADHLCSNIDVIRNRPSKKQTGKLN